MLRIAGIKETYPYDGNDTSDEDEYTEFSEEDEELEFGIGSYGMEPCDHDRIVPWCHWCQEIAEEYGLDDWM